MTEHPNVGFPEKLSNREPHQEEGAALADITLAELSDRHEAWQSVRRNASIQCWRMLGYIYVRAPMIEADDEATQALMATMTAVAKELNLKKWKASDQQVVELLIAHVAGLGKADKSRRSKYSVALRGAEYFQVARDEEAFKTFMEDAGGLAGVRRKLSKAMGEESSDRSSARGGGAASTGTSGSVKTGSDPNVRHLQALNPTASKTYRYELDGKGRSDGRERFVKAVARLRDSVPPPGEETETIKIPHLPDARFPEDLAVVLVHGRAASGSFRKWAHVKPYRAVTDRGAIAVVIEALVEEKGAQFRSDWRMTAKERAKITTKKGNGERNHQENNDSDVGFTAADIVRWSNEEYSDEDIEREMALREGLERTLDHSITDK